MSIQNLSDRYSLIEEQLKSWRRAEDFLSLTDPLKGLRGKLDAIKSLTESNAFARLHEEAERQRRWHETVMAPRLAAIEASQDRWATMIREIQEKIAPAREALSLITERHVEQLRLMQDKMQAQTASITATFAAASRVQEFATQLGTFRINEAFAPAVLNIDSALSAALNANVLFSRMQVHPAFAPSIEKTEDQPDVADRDTETGDDLARLSTAQLAAMADAMALMFEVVIGLDPYFLGLWVETLTTPGYSDEEVGQARRALVDALNARVPRSDDGDDGKA